MDTDDICKICGLIHQHGRNHGTIMIRHRNKLVPVLIPSELKATIDSIDLQLKQRVALRARR